MFEGVSTTYQVLLDHPELDVYDLSSLTRCTVGGQSKPVPRSQEVEERFGCPLIELWGMTEISGLGTTHPLYGPNKHGAIVRTLHPSWNVASPLWKTWTRPSDRRSRGS
jgi:long-chain acyl-CoA synthetase